MLRVRSKPIQIPVWSAHQRIRFLVVGVWNTLFAYLAYGAVYALLHGHVHYLAISVLTHALAVTNAFVCQRHLVFGAQTPWWSAFLKFNLVQLGVLAWSLAGMVLLVELLHCPAFIGQMLVMSVGIVASYLVNLKYTFRV